MSLTDVEHAYLREQFLQKVNKATGTRPTGEHYNLTEDCWDWTGSYYVSGHGQFQTDLCKKLGIQKAHRLSMYFLKPVEWNKDLHVLHACDRPQCVNPAHLRMGTQADNIKDRDERKRHVALKGADNGWAKFTDTQVKEIQELRRNGMIYRLIADKFNCSRRTIEKICLGRKGYSNEIVIPM